MFPLLQRAHFPLPGSGFSSSPRCSAWTVIALDDGWTHSPAGLLSPLSAALDSLANLFWCVGLLETCRWLLLAKLELELLHLLAWLRPCSLPVRHFSLASLIPLQNQFLQKALGSALGQLLPPHDCSPAQHVSVAGATKTHSLFLSRAAF